MAFGQSNSSTVNQGTVSSTENSQATVTQTGQDNNSTVGQQYGQYHEAIVEQVGDDNLNDLYQDNTNTFADIDQKGDDNVSDVYQRSRKFIFGGADVSTVDLDQIGDDNVADVRQDAGSPSGQTKTNQATIQQEGNENEVVLEQNRSSFGTSNPSSNKAEISQAGYRNYTDASQDGRGHGLEESTTGDDNNLESTQTGRFQFLRASVSGNLNEIYSTQADAANRTFLSIDGDNNAFTQDQSGSSNGVGASITGSGNDVDVTQSGSGLKVVKDGSKFFQEDGILIDGSNNTVSIGQTGSMHRANVDVVGSNNSATITQSN
jgi:hypothetical protein